MKYWVTGCLVFPSAKSTLRGLGRSLVVILFLMTKFRSAKPEVEQPQSTNVLTLIGVVLCAGSKEDEINNESLLPKDFIFNGAASNKILSIHSNSESLFHCL